MTPRWLPDNPMAAAVKLVGLALGLATLAGVGVGLWVRTKFVEKRPNFVRAAHDHRPRCLPDPFGNRPHFVETR